MTRKVQKDREAKILATLENYLRGSLVLDTESREKPDFTGTYDGVRVGIEVTKIFRGMDEGRKGSRLREAESRQERCMRELKMQISNMPSAEVEVSWAHLPPRYDLERGRPDQWQGVRTKEVACQIAEAIRPEWPESGDSVTLYRDDHWPPRLPDSVDYVTISRICKFDGVKVRSPGFGGYPEPSTAEVKRAVVAKESLVDGYRSNAEAEEIWLVIDAGGLSESTLWNHEGLGYFELVTAFQRVFVVDHWAPEVREIRIRD